MNKHITIERGVLNINGHPTFVWSADYPYYRDERADWSRQLDNLKKMHVNVVTFYISWRHHAPKDPLLAGGKYDFRGDYNDRTDVLEFIRLIKEKGMLCVAKPGPYIHGETRFGSLPDYVMPDYNAAIEMRQDIAGQPVPAPYVFTNKPPAPMDPEYLKYVKDWMEHVAREVIVPNEYPNGPIVAMQVLNEGVYSRGAAPVDLINFESSGVARYREFLGRKYGTIEAYNSLVGTAFKSFAEIGAPKPWTPQTTRGAMFPWIDWAIFCEEFHHVIAKTYIDYLTNAGTTVPVVMNINTPAEAHGTMVDNHVGRFNPTSLGDVLHYGYTNWCGVVQRNPDAYKKYKIVGKAARGINMEENWGFESYDPPHYWYTQPSFFQSLAYMLWGATGLNIYLGVSCDCWTSELATDPGSLYMGNHPIAHDGSFRDSFWTCHQMGALMKNVGEDLVAQDVRPAVGWALYSSYAHAASWNIPEADWKRAGFNAKPQAASPGWDSFMTLCEKNRTTNGICYPAEDAVARLLEFPILFLSGGDWMDEATQRKLVDYVEKGGVLVLTSQIPQQNERLQPCTLLKDALFPCALQMQDSPEAFDVSLDQGAFKASGCGLHWTVTDNAGLKVIAVAHSKPCAVMAERGQGKALFLGFNPWTRVEGNFGLVEYLAAQYAGVKFLAPLVPPAGRELVEVMEYRNDARSRRQVYILTRQTQPENYPIRMNQPDGASETFEIQLPACSGALVGFEKGRILSAFIKGFNDIDKSAAAPVLKYGDDRLSAADPCDLYYCRGADQVCELSVVNVQNEHGHTLVIIPEPVDNISHIVHLTSDGRETPVKIRDADGLAGFMANDMRHVKSVYTPKNLAYHAAMTASSSSQAIWGPDKAVDGARGTHWISQPEDNQWIMADLGKVQNIQEVIVGWETAYAREYTVEISEDGEIWRPICTEPCGRPGRKLITLHDPRNARFVRVNCIHSGHNNGFSMYELTVRAHPAADAASNTVWSPCYMIYLKA